MQNEKRISAKWLALIIGIVCIGTYVVNYYLRNILSVTTPDLISTGNFTEISIGVLSSTYMIFYAGGQLVNGFLGDIFSPKWMIFVGIGVASVATIIFPFLSYQALRIICFAVLGFGLSMVRGPLMKIISENTEPRHARLICVFFSIASFTGPLIASLFSLSLPVNYAFIVSGGIAFLIVFFSFLVLSSMQKKQYISFKPIKSKSLSSILEVFKIENFVFYMAIAALIEIAVTSITFWLPTFLSDHLGYDNTASKLIFSVISICRSCMPFIALMIFNATGERPLPLMRIGFSLSALFFILMQFIDNKLVNVILIILALMSISLTSAMLWSIYIPSLGKTGRASSANGVLDCTGYIFAALANFLFASISNAVGWEVVLILWASIGVIGLIVTLFNKEKKTA